MNNAAESFAGLLNPALMSDITLFVAAYIQFAMASGGVLFFLRERFMVKEIGIDKAGSIFAHESLVVWFIDKFEDKEHTLVIERTPSNRLQSSFPSGFPNGRQILESMHKAIEKFPIDNETIPLLPLPTTSSESPDSQSNLPTPIYVPRISLLDSITSSISRVAAAASRSSPSSSNLANDRISGVPNLNPEDCIKRFKPQGLPLFDLVLLALVLHQEFPYYTLFRNQCYFFANVLFQTIIQIYSLPPSPSTSLPSGLLVEDGNFTLDPGLDPIPSPTAPIGTPKDANLLILPLDLHGQSGRCMGMLINDPIVLMTVVSIVMRTFKHKLRLHIDEAMTKDNKTSGT